MVHSAPKIVRVPADLHKDIIHAPAPLWRLSHSFGAALADFVREVSAEPIDPVADHFMANIDATLVKRVSDIAQRQREKDVQQHA